MRALSIAWRNMFIFANAQVEPLFSCPYSEKSFEPTCWPHLISSEPEPHVGSEILSPGWGSTSRAINCETSGGV